MNLNTTAWAGLTFQALAYYLFPVILWVALTRFLRVSWRMVGLGALTWLTALPAILLIPMSASAFLGGGDSARMGLVWGIALSFTAGIVEELSRYFWYRRNPTLRDPSNRRQALVAGAGHGGTEALLLGVQNVIAPLAILLVAPQMISAEMQQALSDNSAVASFALIGGVSRMLLIVAHIGFTLLVWRAVSRKQPLYLLGAIALHIVVDLLALVVPTFVPGGEWLAVLIALLLAGWALRAIIAERRQLAAASAGSLLPTTTLAR